MEDKIILRTPCQTEREARDLAIYNEYNTLMETEGQSKVMAKDFLMKKYNIHSPGTIYVILKRVEQRLRGQEGMI